MARKKSSLQSSSNATNSASKDKFVCCFCGLSEDNEIVYGKFYKEKNIVTHYYCLLLSSNMEQKGEDEEGILGFLIDDINKEVRRGRRLHCSYCKKNGATLGCCNVKCKRIFHYPCGLKNNSLHQFFDEFRSYCVNHRPKQKIDEKVKQEVKNNQNTLCCICYDDVQPFDTNGTLWAPCCKKNAWFHRHCVQQLAMSAGYFFKCPLCNNKNEFQVAMLEHGIYIPKQDASWELVPNAFSELLYRHDRCNAKTCLCPKGRTYTSDNVKWDLVLCRVCGSQGTHLHCAGLSENRSENPFWECNECKLILKKSGSTSIQHTHSSSASTPINRQISNRYQEQKVSESEDSDSDISVGNEIIPLQVNSSSNILISRPEIKLRPGPRFYKLQQVNRLSAEIGKKNDISIDNKKSKKDEIFKDVICIDSDDEPVQILCESSMKRNNLKHRINPKRSNSLNTSGSCSSTSENSTEECTLKNWDDISSQLKNVVSPTNINSSVTIIPIQKNKGKNEDSKPINNDLVDPETSPLFVISNVVSVPPECFPIDTDSTDSEIQLQEKEISNDSSGSLKRKADNESIICLEDESDSKVVEKSKRTRYSDIEKFNNLKINEQSVNLIEQCANNSDDKKNVSPLPNDLSIQNLINSGNNDITIKKVYTETSNTSKLTSQPTAFQNCHGHAGSGPAVEAQCSEGDKNGFYPKRRSTRGSTKASNIQRQLESTKLTEANVIATSYSDVTLNKLHPNGSKRSRNSTSHNRFGLIPDAVKLSSLKFKLNGDCLKMTCGSHSFQIKLKEMSNPSTLPKNVNRSILSPSKISFTNSNLDIPDVQNDYSNNEIITNKLNINSIKNEQLPNTKISPEYSISTQKENWDPEISSSSDKKLQDQLQLFNRKNMFSFRSDNHLDKINQSLLLSQLNHTMISDKSIRSKFFQFYNTDLFFFNMNDLSFSLLGKRNLRNAIDLKVRIDLRKIQFFIKTNPILFKKREKGSIKFHENKFLFRSRSLENLKNDELPLLSVKSRSCNNLSLIKDNNKSNLSGKIIRRSPRRKRKFFEIDCVR